MSESARKEFEMSTPERKKVGRFHWVRHLIGWAPSEFVMSICGGRAILIRCVICGRETWLE